MSTPIEIGQLTRLELGFVGETGSRDIQVDMTTWLDRWPEGAIAILVRRPVTDEVFYLAATEVEGSILTWKVTETDVAVAGRGMAQISIYDQDSRAVYKSRTVQTIIKASIDETLDEDAPDPMDTWVAHAAVEADRATSARQMAAAARDEAVDAAEDAKDYAAAAEGYASRAESAANEAEGGATSASASATQAKAYALRAESAEASAETSKTSAAASAQDAASSKAAAEAHKTAALGGAQRAESAAAEAQGAVDGFDDTVAAAVEEISASKQAAVDAVAAKVDEVLASIPEDYMTLVAAAKTHAPAIIAEATGDVATCMDAAARDAVAVVSTIEAVQEGEGDPSPDNVRPITGWSAVRLWHGAAYDESAEPVLTADLPEVVYGGTLDLVSGVLTVTHQLLDVAIRNWKASSSVTGRFVATQKTDSLVAGSHYPVASGSGQANTFFRSSSGQIAVNTAYATLDEWTAYLAAQKAAGTPVMLLYEMQEADRYTIQLTTHQVTMLGGSNAMWSDTGGTSVVYVADTQTYVDDRVSAWEQTGLTIAALGDSIMAGDGNAAVGIGEILAERIGGECWEYAKGGATIVWDTADAASSDVLVRRQNILYQADLLIGEHATAPDIILLDGGTNDISTGATTLGEVTPTYEDDLDTGTFAGAMESLIKRLKNAYPSSVILYIRPHRMGSRSNVRQTTFGDMAVAICDKWSVGLVDVYNRSGLNTWLSAYHQYTYKGDMTHPTQEGYDRYYIPLILAEVKRHIGEV